MLGGENTFVYHRSPGGPVSNEQKSSIMKSGKEPTKDRLHGQFGGRWAHSSICYQSGASRGDETAHVDHSMNRDAH